VGSKVKVHKTSGGCKTPVRLTIPLGIVIFLVVHVMHKIFNSLKYLFCI